MREIMGTASRSAPLNDSKYKKISEEVRSSIKENNFAKMADKTIDLAANLAGVGTIYDVIKSGIAGYKMYQKTGSRSAGAIEAARTFAIEGFTSGLADVTMAAIGGPFLGRNIGQYAKRAATWAIEESYSRLIGD
jgi:hypothetical protein